MIESMAQWLTVHADHAPLFVFGLLLLAGFSLPISEDVLVIVSGVVASTVIPEQTVPLFIAVFLGSYFSDWIAYWIGRGIGPKLSRLALFRRTLSIERRHVVEKFFRRYGFLTLFIGRLIPFGVRNSVFMAAGAGKMHFGRFMLGDGLSCLLFSSVVFFLAFRAGENYDRLHKFVAVTGYVAACVALLSLVAWIVWVRVTREERAEPN
jgi:membrane protein DedA with SNARE-associated domain